MSLRTIRLWLGGVLLAVLSATVVLPPFQALAQEDLGRKIRTRVAPVYPDIARRMAITGRVKLSVVISPNGTVKDAKVIGGHPILVNAAMDAVKKWKYEPGAGESSGTVEISFEGQK